MTAAQERGKMAVAYHSDMRKIAPDAQIVAVTHHWGDYYVSRVQAVLAGTWQPANVWAGVDKAMVRAGFFGAKVPKAVQDEVIKRQSEIARHRLHPFLGPIRDNAGREVVPQGKVLSDQQILAMDWLAEGVQGKLSK